MRRLASATVTAILLAACGNAPPGGDGSSTGGAGGAVGTGGVPTGTTSETTTTASTGTTTTGTTTGTTTTGTTTGTSSSGGTSAVTVMVTPDSTIVSKMVSAIGAATKSVHMTMYILDNSSVVNALVARKQAGVDVRVILNKTFPSGTTQSNPATYNTLTAAGVGVVWRNGPPGATTDYTHEKTFIIDGKTAWIGTMNLSATAGQHNREYVAVDTDPTDVAEADAIFLADYAGTSAAASGPLVVSPDNSRNDLVALINTATKTLDLEVEEFSDVYGGGITAAVAAAAHRGVATRVIVANSSPSANQTSSITTVKAAGTQVVVSGGTSGSATATKPYIHAKAITVDCNGTTCARGWVGSENFTGASLGYNRELGVIIDNAAQLAGVQSAINHDFSVGTPQ